LNEAISSTTVIQAVLSGVLLGGLYASVAVGLALVLALTRSLNIAHGDLVVLGGYVAYTLWERVVPFPLTVLAAAAALVPLGLVWHRITGWIPEPLGTNSIVVTFALSLLLQNAMATVWRGDYRLLAPPALLTPVELGGVSVPLVRLIVGALAAAVLGGLAWAFAHTRWGRALRATSVNSEGAALVGIDTSACRRLAFVIAAAVAGAAGALLGTLHYLHPVGGTDITLVAIILTMWASATRPGLLLCSGVVVGVLETAVVVAWGPVWREPGIAAVLLGSLLLRRDALNAVLRA
jgi:branched-chain amino acid transport system permease protein